MEFEIRFGKYGKISSNIKQTAFMNILKLAHRPSYKFIDETFYADSSNVRKRVIYRDSKQTEQMFKSGIFNAIIMSKIEKSSTGKTIFITKDKTRGIKPIKTGIVKADIVNERIVESHNAAINFTKKKFRCSWLVQMWRFDVTALLVTKDGKSAIFYEVEIEYNQDVVTKNNYTFEQITNEANKHINSITTIIECCSKALVDVEMRHEIHNAVVTLERKDLEKLQHAKYAVVDKADGERRFVYIEKGNVYQFNPTEGIISKILITKSKDFAKYTGTLIDCELIDDKTFYGFDLLFYEGVDYRNYNLIERLFLLKKVIDKLNVSKLNFKLKTFHMDAFSNVKKIWDNRKKLFPYELDGLIFTPIHGAYLGNLPNFKFKPLVSIDVKIMYNNRDNFTEFYGRGYPKLKHGEVVNAYVDRESQKTYYRMKMFFNDPILKQMGVVNNYGVLGMPGKIDQPNMANIAEMEFNSGKWKFLRTRPDKEHANSFKSIQSALIAISDNITIDELSKLNHIKSAYEKVGNDCFTKSGFNFSSPDITSDVCSFYTYAYSKMVIGKGSLLVIGCDMCLLNGLLQSNYNTIDIYEENCLEVHGYEKSEGYKGLKEQLASQTTSKKIKINWGAFTGKSTKYDAVFINNLCDMKVIGKYPAKLVMGTYLSKERVEAYMSKHPCIVLRNGDLHPLWKLQYQKGKVEIRRLRNSFTTECNVISDKVVKKCKSFKSLYTPYKKTGGRLSEYDCIIADITRMFYI
jgi:hypothetical protein